MAKISNSVLSNSLSEWMAIEEPKPNFGFWVNEKWCFKDEILKEMVSSTQALRRCKKYHVKNL